MEGFYSVTYQGSGGLGVAVLVLNDGRVVGADAAGGLYDGQYRSHGDGVGVTVTVTIPPGTSLVTGVPPQPQAYTFPINTKLPVNFGGGHAVSVQTPTGIVQAVFKKLRDL